MATQPAAVGVQMTQHQKGPVVSSKCAQPSKQKLLQGHCVRAEGGAQHQKEAEVHLPVEGEQVQATAPHDEESPEKEGRSVKARSLTQQVQRLMVQRLVVQRVLTLDALSLTEPSGTRPAAEVA